MTPVLMAACLLAGVLIGLRVNARRLAATREQLRVLADRHDAWNLSAKRTDLDEVGPVTGDHRPVELFDQDRLAELRDQAADPLAFAASVGREHAAIQPPAMTGARDVDAQDRELADIYGIAPDGYCPVEGHHTTVGRRDHGDWLTWCTCGWEAPSTNQAEANQLYAEHQQQMESTQSREMTVVCDIVPDYRTWSAAVASPVDDDPADPRVLPEGRVSD